MAPSRLKPSSVPLTTTANPARVWASASPATSPSGSPASMRRPAARRPSMSLRLCGSSNQARTDAAMIGPNPSTAAKDSSSASWMLSTFPNAAAST